MRISVRSEKGMEQVDCRAGETLLGVLRARGYAIAADCNGRGTCGKCTVFVRGGAFGEAGKKVLACQTSAFEGCEVTVSERRGGGLIEGGSEEFSCDGEEGFGLAVDIGTTTIAYALVRLSDGKTLARRAELNRQQAFGADVISRIQSAGEGNLNELCRLVQEQIESAAQGFLKEFALPSLQKTVVCGNTTMLHLFCGESVAGIGQHPFRPVFTNLRKERGERWGLCAEEAVILPSVSAFVGADIVAGAIASGADKKDALLVDIGTNGEMLVRFGGKTLCTSTAAGPCFEGANIECGIGGVAGAIDSFRFDGEKKVFTTVNGAPPRGVCGAGLVDAVAAMLEKEVIDETGAFQNGDRFVLTEGVYLTQKDVRAFQLAKSAILAGMKVLSSRAGVPLGEQKNILIAGGLGFYLNGENARKTGLLPKENAERQHVVGNAALAGTVQCMLSRAALERAVSLSTQTEYIDLSADAEFMDEYILNMSF